jgi:hypothetical protein
MPAIGTRGRSASKAVSTGIVKESSHAVPGRVALTHPALPPIPDERFARSGSVTLRTPALRILRWCGTLGSSSVFRFQPAHRRTRCSIPAATCVRPVGPMSSCGRSSTLLLDSNRTAANRSDAALIPATSPAVAWVTVLQVRECASRELSGSDRNPNDPLRHHSLQQIRGDRAASQRPAAP